LVGPIIALRPLTLPAIALIIDLGLDLIVMADGVLVLYLVAPVTVMGAQRYR